ncbi:MAG: SpoIIE family protein phosphatase [Acidobacteriota bacterium]|nr:SpoIIE family protein phosphatase [Acidobacteriota bacterium]
MRKRPTAQYVVLAVLFVIAVAFQTRVAWHFLTPINESPFGVRTATNVITHAHMPEAVKAGVKDGDLLLAVNGNPYRGAATLAEPVESAGKDGAITVTVRSSQPHGQTLVRTEAVKLKTRHLLSSGMWGVTGIILYIALPFFCLLLGFWVAAARPRDAVAWLVLGLLLGFTQLVSISCAGWGPWLRDFGAIYHIGLNSTWAIWMLLVGLYFPEPFPAGRLRNWWTRLGWLVGALLFASAIGSVIQTVGGIENYASIATFNRIFVRTGFYAGILVFVAIGSFFAATAVKAGITASRDAKRRLKLLYVGTSISFWPIFILLLVVLVTGKSFEQVYPAWLIILSLLLICLFPLTLAYVIVVERAMDVRFVIRRGLRYAFAKHGINAVQMAVGIALIYGVIVALRHVRPDSALFFAAIAAGFVIFIGIRGAFRRARGWADRKFFRDAYNAEQILIELSEQVRNIVEVGPLVETVSRSIADSLHVTRIAVFLDGSGSYAPAYALGYGKTPDVAFAGNAATVRQLEREHEPARIYFDDANSWMNRPPGIAKEEKTKLSTLGSELLLPLAAKEKLLGFISLGQKKSEQPYTTSDLRLLKSVAAQTGLALENARLANAVAEEMAERRKLDREVEIAREVQERLFPQKLPPVPGLDYFGACRPARGVGGDYYDFLALPEGKLGFAVGDVSGKGISAALMMASLQATLRGEVTRGSKDLKDLMGNLNKMVFEASSDNRYATFFYGQYDPADRKIIFVNAGHNPPLLFRLAGEAKRLERLEASGAVIGLIENTPYQQAEVRLNPGDLLVAYTDGVSEAMNAMGEEWGENRMVNAIEACDGLRPSEMIHRIIAAADGFAAGAQQHDDMTLVVLRAV